MCTGWKIKFSVAIFSPFNYYKERTAHIQYNAVCIFIVVYLFCTLVVGVACSFKTMQVNMRT